MATLGGTEFLRALLRMESVESIALQEGGDRN